MRSLSGTKQPDKPADPLTVHPDIRRMLLTQKSFAEGGRALGYYAALLLDIVNRSSDAEERKRADDLLSFLTPIVKALLTEAANECAYHALQVFGGHGYIQETGIEQIARDARITTIYEGTTQIQALDLLGRKVIGQQGKGLRILHEEVVNFCRAHGSDPRLMEYLTVLQRLLSEWLDLTQWIGIAAQKNPDEMGAAAVDYLFYSGYVLLAYFWARTVQVVQSSDKKSDFKQAKLETARFYFARILPRTATHAAAIRSGSGNLLTLPEECFGLN